MKKISLISIIMIVCINANILAEKTKNIFTCKVGNIELHVLLEGERTGNPDILLNATQEMLAKSLPNGEFPMATNAFFFRADGRNILIDAGHGINLFDNLQELNVSAEQIDIVLITHCHGDHINGLLRNGKESFPNATIYMAEREHNYWLGEANSGGGFDNAKKVFAPYLKRNAIKRFKPDELGGKVNMLLPEIQAIVLYGHTPGHTGFMLGNGENRIFIWADLTHCTPVQMLYPAVSVSFDTDGEQAAAIRKQVLGYVVKNKITVAGSHISYPGIGKINQRVSSEQYNFTPINNILPTKK